MPCLIAKYAKLNMKKQTILGLIDWCIDILRGLAKHGYSFIQSKERHLSWALFA